jgi:hypothetical protein
VLHALPTKNKKKNHAMEAYEAVEVSSVEAKGLAIVLKRLVAGFPPRRPGSSHVGFVVDKVALGAGFLRVLLRFPLPIFIPPISPQSPSPIIWGWYNK